jgi:hypothetical protein
MNYIKYEILQKMAKLPGKCTYFSKHPTHIRFEICAKYGI